MKRLYFIAVIVFVFSISCFAQLTLPRESQRQEIVQTLGDAKISVVYHRPNIKGRKIWGALVPYGEAWRTGANENTTIEFSRDVSINGQPLSSGKYGLHTIPNKKEWTVIFNNVNNEWGSFAYDAKKDALRVNVKPQKSEFRETLVFGFRNVTPNSTDVVLSWEKLVVPFKVDIGDVHGRMVTQIREAIKTRKADQFGTLNQGANYVRTFKLAANYDEALGWIDTSIKARETFGNLSTKAGILANMGKYAEAIALGEKAVDLGKKSTPPANVNAVAALENSIKEWKAKK